MTIRLSGLLGARPCDCPFVVNFKIERRSFTNIQHHSILFNHSYSIILDPLMPLTSSGNIVICQAVFMCVVKGSGSMQFLEFLANELWR